MNEAPYTDQRLKFPVAPLGDAHLTVGFEWVESKAEAHASY